MGLYKVGMNVYATKEDMNCGMYELNILKKVTKEKKSTFILNGKVNNEEKDFFLQLTKKEDCYFILTDATLAECNIEIIKNCKKLFHSSMLEDYSERFGIEGQYSYIPNMFLNVDSFAKYMYKNDLCLFGGSFGGKIETDENFLQLKNLVGERTLMLTKNDKYDARLQYKDYLKLMKSFAFCICSKRKEYEEIKWVTPRFLDALSCYSMPIIHKSYDLQSLYEYDDSLIFGDNHSFEKIFQSYTSDNRRNAVIEDLIKKNKSKINMFEKLIEDIK